MRDGLEFRTSWFPRWSLRLAVTLPLVALVLAALLLSGEPASAQSNSAPVFNPTTVTLSVAENTPPGTDIGDPVTATDADNDTLTYSLDGFDSVFFSIVSTTGQIQAKANLDYEDDNTFDGISVIASDGNGGTGEALVKINVTDVDEPTPAAPTVSLIPGYPSSVLVSWAAPAHTGPLLSYDLRWREVGRSWWIGPQGVVGQTQVIHGLTSVLGEPYEVQVRAKTDEFISGWSPSSAEIAPDRYPAEGAIPLPGQNHDPRCNLPLIANLGRFRSDPQAMATDSQVTLSWKRDPFDHSVGEKGDCIWRSENFTEYQLLGFFPNRHGTEHQSYVDNDVLPSSEYSYLLRTVNAQGMSRGFRTVSAVTGAMLAGLSASATRTAVTLSWDDPEDGTITGYRILRRVNWGTETTLTTGVGGSATSYVDRNVSPDTAYAYRVQVVRGTQAGYPSPWVTALTLPGSPGSSSSVSERANQDLPSDTTTTGLLKLDESVTGVITSATDVDWFAVDLTAGENYFFRLSYDGERVDGNGALVVGNIRDADGNRAEYDSFLLYCCYQSSGAFSPNRTGRYYVPVVLNYNNYEPFYAPLPLTYTLELHSDQINEFIGLPEVAGTDQAEVGRWTSGALHGLDTRDDYRVELCGGRRYRVPLFRNLTADADGVMRRPSLFASGPVGPVTTNPYTEPFIMYAPRTGTYLLHLFLEPGDEPESIYANNGRLERDSTVLGGGRLPLLRGAAGRGRGYLRPTGNLRGAGFGPAGEHRNGGPAALRPGRHRQHRRGRRCGLVRGAL